MKAMRNLVSLHEGRTITLEPTAHIVDLYPGHQGDEPVYYPGRQDPAEVVLLSLPAPATYRLVSLPEHLQKSGDVPGIILPVTVHGDDPISLGELISGRKGGRLPEVAVKLHHPHGPIPLRYLLEELPRPVGATIVHEDDLVPQPQPLHHLLELVVKELHISFLVVHGYGHRNLRPHPSPKISHPSVSLQL